MFSDIPSECISFSYGVPELNWVCRLTWFAICSGDFDADTTAAHERPRQAKGGKAAAGERKRDHIYIVLILQTQSLLLPVHVSV